MCISMYLEGIEISGGCDSQYLLYFLMHFVRLWMDIIYSCKCLTLFLLLLQIHLVKIQGAVRRYDLHDIESIVRTYVAEMRLLKHIN